MPEAGNPFIRWIFWNQCANSRCTHRAPLFQLFSVLMTWSLVSIWVTTHPQHDFAHGTWTVGTCSDPLQQKCHPAMTSQPGWTLPCYAQWVPQRQNWNLSFVQDLMIEVMWNWMSFVWPGAGKYLAIVNCKHLAIWVSLCTQGIHSIITHSCKYKHMRTMNFPDSCGCSWTSLGFTQW